MPPCAENKIGLIFYRYMVTNILTLNGVDILMTLVQRLLGMAVPYDPATVCLLSHIICSARSFWI